MISFPLYRDIFRFKQILKKKKIIYLSKEKEKGNDEYPKCKTG